MFRSRTNDLAAGDRSTREEDVVERQGRQVCGFLRPAQQHLDAIRRQRGLHPLGHDLGGGRRLLRRLDHDPVAGSQGGDHRLHRQQEREVPRCDDEHDPLGLVHDFRSGPQQLNGRRTPLRAHPIPEVLPHESNLLADGKELRQPGFRFRFPQILVQGLQEGVLVVAKPAQHVGQQGTPLAQGGGGLLPMGRPKGLKGRSQFLVGQSFSNSLMLPTLPSMPLAS